MNKMYELYDEAANEHVSFHKTLHGALNALSDRLEKVKLDLEVHYGDGYPVDFALKYRVISVEVKD